MFPVIVTPDDVLQVCQMDAQSRIRLTQPVRQLQARGVTVANSFRVVAVERGLLELSARARDNAVMRSSIKLGSCERITVAAGLQHRTKLEPGRPLLAVLAADGMFLRLMDLLVDERVRVLPPPPEPLRAGSSRVSAGDLA